MSSKLRVLDAKLYNQIRLIDEAKNEMRDQYIAVMHQEQMHATQAVINQTFIYLESVEDSLTYAREMLDQARQHRKKLLQVKTAGKWARRY